MNVSWAWYDQGQGAVEWTFSNPSTSQESAILFRNGYPFGGAFWPVYYAYFGVPFLDAAPTPLADYGAPNNDPVLCLCQMPNGTLFPCFVFTLAPGQSWSIIEYGFSSTDLPSSYSMVDATLLDAVADYCVAFDPNQCSQYTLQSASCPPNPVQVTSIVMSVAQDISLAFSDTVQLGTGCARLSLAPSIVPAVPIAFALGTVLLIGAARRHR